MISIFCPQIMSWSLNIDICSHKNILADLPQKSVWLKTYVERGDDFIKTFIVKHQIFCPTNGSMNNIALDHIPPMFYMT